MHKVHSTLTGLEPKELDRYHKCLCITCHIHQLHSEAKAYSSSQALLKQFCVHNAKYAKYFHLKTNHDYQFKLL